MRIGEVIGTVTLNRAGIRAWPARRYRLAVPLSLAELASGDAARAASRSWCTTSWAPASAAASPSAKGREAAQPFHPDEKPIDAYNAAILDHMQTSELNVGLRHRN